MKVVVKPSGPIDAFIAIVGEAPGKTEEQLGEPFKGKAGELLNLLLSTASIPRSSIYFDNVIPVRPPDTANKTNDISFFVDLSKKYPLLTDLYKQYREELIERLKKVNTNVIVAMGGVSLFALTGIHPHKITSRRGSIYYNNELPGKKIIACIHPAACLYDYGKKKIGAYIYRYFISYDLMRAKYETEHPEMGLPERELIINPSLSRVMEFIEECKTKDIIGVDIESSRERQEITHISFAVDGGMKSICIPFVDGRGLEYFPLQEEIQVWNAIATLLDNPNIRKVGQYIIFDSQYIFRKYGIVMRNMEDTMIASGIWCPDFPKDLGFISSLHTREPYYKDESKTHSVASSKDERFQIYSAKDSAVTLESFPVIISYVEKMGNIETYKTQDKLIEPLLYMEERGIKLDLVGIANEKKEVSGRIDELTTKIQRMVGFSINIDSPRQLMEYFYVTKGIKPYLKKGTGNWTTDITALKRLANKGIPEASILLETRKLSAYQTFLNRKVDEDGRMRSAFNPAGASDSGRLSSGKTIWDTGGDMQNLPKSFRRFLLFDEGYVGYEMDLGQAESRIVALIGPEPTMWKLFQENKDIHSYTGAAIYTVLNKKQISAAAIKEMDKAEEKAPIGTGENSWRFWGKSAGYAFNYGRGYRSFSLMYECSEAEAKQIYLAYHSLYPAVKGVYWNWVVEKLRIDRSLTNPYGRKRRFMNQWGDELFKEAYNFIPQSTVADKINREGLIYIYYNQDKFKDLELLNQIHDSIVFQLPLSIGWKKHVEILSLIKNSLEQPITWRSNSIVLPANIKMGRNMKDMSEVEINEKRLEEVWVRSV